MSASKDPSSTSSPTRAGWRGHKLDLLFKKARDLGEVAARDRELAQSRDGQTKSIGGGHRPLVGGARRGGFSETLVRAADAKPQMRRPGPRCTLDPHGQPLPHLAPITAPLVKLFQGAHDAGGRGIKIQRAAQIAISVVQTTGVEQHENPIGDGLRARESHRRGHRPGRMHRQRIVAALPIIFGERKRIGRRTTCLDDLAIKCQRPHRRLLLHAPELGQPPQQRDAGLGVGLASRGPRQKLSQTFSVPRFSKQPFSRLACGRVGGLERDHLEPGTRRPFPISGRRFGQGRDIAQKTGPRRTLGHEADRRRGQVQ